MENKIRFKDLSIWLKIAVCMAYFDLFIYSLAFIIGFVKALI